MCKIKLQIIAECGETWDKVFDSHSDADSFIEYLMNETEYKIDEISMEKIDD